MVTDSANKSGGQLFSGWTVARVLGGLAVGPTLFGGGMLRLIGVLLVGIGVGALGTWLVQRARPVRCVSCRTAMARSKAARGKVAGARGPVVKASRGAAGAAGAVSRGTVRVPAQRPPTEGRGPAGAAVGRARPQLTPSARRQPSYH